MKHMTPDGRQSRRRPPRHNSRMAHRRTGRRARLYLPLALALQVLALDAGAADLVDAPRAAIDKTTRNDPAGAPFQGAGAGWGPELGNGVMASRWAEDWRTARATGSAPPFKAMPLADAMSLTLSGEIRLRIDSYRRAQLLDGKDVDQGLARGIVGADLRVHPGLRLYAELGTARVWGQSGAAAGNFRNVYSLQQGFLDAHRELANGSVGIMLGRQEFSDGPRQLMSLGDGPNLHRSWNGARAYMQAGRLRLVAFDFRATRLGVGRFDEQVNPHERLRGLVLGYAIASGPAAASYLEPFWYATRNSNFRQPGRTGTDERDTVGVRWWGQRGPVRYDWTAARQSGSSLRRRVDAWGLFATQSVQLSRTGWKPRLTARIDVASGGAGAAGNEVRTFHPLYGSSAYLGEGQFLGLSNLLMFTPGITVSPRTRATVSVEYGMARRLVGSDSAYGGGMRAYSGTQFAPGKDLGALVRVTGSWSPTARLSLFLNYEDMHPGRVLAATGLRRGRYLYGGLTYRY